VAQARNRNSVPYDRLFRDLLGAGPRFPVKCSGGHPNRGGQHGELGVWDYTDMLLQYGGGERSADRVALALPFMEKVT